MVGDCGRLNSCGGKKGEVYMFMGEFQHNIDAKGRLIVPSKLREELGEKFVVTR
ncbi:MAG: cell division/cell wall cluster transcriptional repressor MraZ, partial [Enterococcus sp.]|nr:cell division/cell wall cluster transcriptional repressor MraZ [Enterococcus sp.]